MVFHRHLYPYIVYIWYFDKFHFTHIFPLFFRYFSAVFRSFSRFLCPCAPLLPGRRTPPALHRNRIMQKSSTWENSEQTPAEKKKAEMTESSGQRRQTPEHFRTKLSGGPQEQTAGSFSDSYFRMPSSRGRFTNYFLWNFSENRQIKRLKNILSCIPDRNRAPIGPQHQKYECFLARWRNAHIKNPQSGTLSALRVKYLVSRRGVEPLLLPWEGRVLSTWPTGHNNS